MTGVSVLHAKRGVFHAEASAPTLCQVWWATPHLGGRLIVEMPSTTRIVVGECSAEDG